MNLLHAIWYQGCLHLWGERENGTAPVEGGTVAGEHPLAMKPAELRAVVGEVCADALLGAVAREAELKLFLPCDSRTGGVLASWAEIPAAEGGGVTWQALRVPVLTLAPTDALDMLTGMKQALPAGCGESVAYWAELARFVLRRVADQQFFPDVQSGGGGRLVALWRLLVATSTEVQALERFAKALPGMCRCVAEPLPFPPVAEAQNFAPLDSATLVESFLITTTDAIVRRDVSTDPFFATFAQRADLPQGPEMRWLGALVGPGRAAGGESGIESAGEGAWVPDGEAGNDGLVEGVKEWVGPLDRSRVLPPVQVRITLEEPEVDEQTDDGAGGGQESPWRLRFGLLPLERESREIDAAELWAKEASESGVLSRSILEWRARLIVELERAKEFCPVIERALAGGGGGGGGGGGENGASRAVTPPTEVTLTAVEAHAFIRQWAPILREKSFSVVLPDWALQRQRELGLVLFLAPPEQDDEEGPGKQNGKNALRRSEPFEFSAGQFGLNSLLDFDWRVAVGRAGGGGGDGPGGGKTTGEQMYLSVEEFQALAERHLPLVKYKGQWLEIDESAVERALTFLKTKAHKKTTLAEAFRTAYGVGAGAARNAETGLPILGLSGGGQGSNWVADFLAQAPFAKMQRLEQPPGFAGTLRPYQSRGLDWMAFLDMLGIGTCLADDMGLGKTIQFIALLLHERRDRFVTPDGPPLPDDATAAKYRAHVGPTLLFAPTSVVGNWVRELQRFAKSLRVLLHHGPTRLRGEAFKEQASASDIVITSYALAYRDFEDLQRVDWHRLALDEAQKIKNPSAAATLAIRKIVAPRRVALTGTPIENHLSELWSIMEVLNPGLLGSASQFRESFSVPIEKLGHQDRAEQLKNLIQPFVLRRLKSDPAIVSDLPEKMETREYCNLTPEQAALYEATTAEMLGQIDTASGMRRRGLILSALTRLKQICDHPRLMLRDAEAPGAKLEGRSGKCERLLEMLEEVVDEGDAALIFTQYRQMGHLLETFLTEHLRQPVLFLHGGTPARGRDSMVERFQTGKHERIFLLSLRAGGLGLNLTAANHVFHFDRWWNPAVEAQATDRAHRIGQTRTVQVHKFICVGTLEERIDRLLTEKLAVAAKIVGSGDQWLTNLSTDELRNYLALSNEAVGDY